MPRAITAKAWARVAIAMMATAILAAGRLTPLVYSMSSDTRAWGVAGASRSGPAAPMSCLDRVVASWASSCFTALEAVAMSQANNRNAAK